MSKDNYRDWYVASWLNQRTIRKPRQADNLKKYKMKHIPKNNVILKTQNMSQNMTKLEWNCNIPTIFQSHHQTEYCFIFKVIDHQMSDYLSVRSCYLHGYLHVIYMLFTVIYMFGRSVLRKYVPEISEITQGCRLYMRPRANIFQ